MDLPEGTSFQDTGERIDEALLQIHLELPNIAEDDGQLHVKEVHELVSM